ncbi:MAG: hypothetical protein KFF73_15085 [Cyclobacteriaceae bacterium]|nr:hypothetical protein [Cyclobacteriaceae bacterium]
MKKLFFYPCCLIILLGTTFLRAQEVNKSIPSGGEHLQVNGVFPHLTVVGAHGARSESGIGALLP